MPYQVTIQNALNAGELSPSLYGRTDLDKYHLGCSTARNFFANYRGGLSSRAGLAYVGMCKQQYPVPPRDIPFQFSLNQGYVLEFGQEYMRIKSNGAYVVESAKNITSISAAAVFTSAGHGFSVGDWVFIEGNTSAGFPVQFSGLTWIINSVTTNTFTVTDLFGNVISSSQASSASGTASRIYTVVSPYAAVDLPYLKYTQSADVMTLTCVNTETLVEYPSYSLARHGNTNWVFTQDTFAATIQAPTGLTANATSSDVLTTWYSYVVTAVNDATGEESVASLPVNVQNVNISTVLGSNTITWDQVAGATSYNVYAATPSYSINVPVSSLYGFIGTALGTSFVDTNITADFTTVPPQHTNPFARGFIEQVTIGGSQNGDYSQSTVSYSVSSATGSGFSGTPVVENGNIVDFVIYDPGQNYQSGDTISFSDSGGGVATGNFVFSANPADTNVVKFNGIQLNFSASIEFPATSGYVYTHLEATLALTLQSLANTLNASTLLSLSVATYTSDATHLYVKYKTPGTVGNAYTLDKATAPCTASGATLTGGGTMGSGATGTLVISPESGTYPSTCQYYQQRRVYGGSLNQPDTYWMSQPGLYDNFDSSTPVTAGGAITGTPWAQQVNGIQFMVPMPGGLVILTGKGAWQVNGGSTAAITPSSQTATPQAYNGCNGIVPPITINYDILYVQSKGSIWRDLAYNFFTNIYTGTDLTVLSSHLFTDFSVIQAAWAEEPYKLVWVVRNDGVMLSLTYLKEQDIYAWTRHDTNGLFIGVCSVTELPVDAVYVITQRFVQGNWYYYAERMDNRVWDTVEDSFCVDAGISTTLSTQDATLNITGSPLLNSTVTGTASSSVFPTDIVGQVIRIGGGKILVTSRTSGSVIVGTVTQEITATVPNDPEMTVIPAQAGEWTYAPLVSTVSGLNHLEGLTVTALADGSVVPPQVVTNNSITLPNPASYVVAGLPYTCQAQTMYYDGPPAGGQTVQNKRKNISAIGLRVEASRGLQVGADQIDASTQQNFQNVPWTDMNEIKERTMNVFAGSAVPLYTGDYYKAITSGWAIEGQVAIQQVYPLPANILGVVTYISVGDDRAP